MSQIKLQALSKLPESKTRIHAWGLSIALIKSLSFKGWLYKSFACPKNLEFLRCVEKHLHFRANCVMLLFSNSIYGNSPKLP
jgi:hypothetical protein